MAGRGEPPASATLGATIGGMAFVPIRIGEKLRIVETARRTPLQREIDDRLVEDWRVANVVRRRRYVEGEQYDRDNLDKFYELGLNPAIDLLPEHEKKHPYSTQVGESVRFIADQLAEEFSVEAVDPGVQEVIEAALRLSGQLSGSGDDDDVSIEELVEEILTAGDVPVELRWEPDADGEGNGAVFYDLWESELVEIEWADRDTMEVVKLREIVWRYDPQLGDEKQVEERTEWSMVDRVSEDGETVWRECERRVYWDNEEDPREQVWTGLPMIPWALLRARRKGLRQHRGDSLVTEQVMMAADRYNAIENIGYLIARHNSHSNLAVVGDAASLKMEQAGYIDKDIDDVLGFPGGTGVQVIDLPTDPEMIEHQRAVLAESIYNAFGLTRVEPDTIQGFGQISGYALEILNRKTEGTFRKIKRSLIRDLRTLFNQTLDLYEALSVSQPLDDDGDVPEVVDVPDVPAWVGMVDEDGERFPNREMELRMGSGYVVDEVLIREDYAADLISRREALRRRGLSNDDIKLIEQEIDEEKSTAASRVIGEASRFAPQAGDTQGQGTDGGTVEE